MKSVSSHISHTSYTQTALAKLKKHGYKITRPKKVLLELLDKSHKALSPYDMRDLLKKQKIRANAVTIYRLLEVFEKLSLVHKVLAFNGYIRCLLTNGKTACHHYVVCSSCHNIDEIEGEDFTTLEKKITKTRKFQVTSHYFELIGLCPKCQ